MNPTEILNLQGFEYIQKIEKWFNCNWAESSHGPAAQWRATHVHSTGVVQPGSAQPRPAQPSLAQLGLRLRSVHTARRERARWRCCAGSSVARTGGTGEGDVAETSPAHEKWHGEKEARRGASPARGRWRGRARGVDGDIEWHGSAATCMGQAEERWAMTEGNECGGRRTHGGATAYPGGAGEGDGSVGAVDKRRLRTGRSERRWFDRGIGGAVGTAAQSRRARVRRQRGSDSGEALSAGAFMARCGRMAATQKRCADGRAWCRERDWQVGPHGSDFSN
jgi:hypothetical protein